MQYFNDVERHFLKLLTSEEAKIVHMDLSIKPNLEISGIDFNASVTLNNEDIPLDKELDQPKMSLLTDSINSFEHKEESFAAGCSVSPNSLKKSAKSSSSLYVKQLFLAHLRLLVNTRDELALACTLGMPGREISDKEFNRIKNVALSKNMPIYQVGFIQYAKCSCHL